MPDRWRRCQLGILHANLGGDGEIAQTRRKFGHKKGSSVGSDEPVMV